jgi:DNA-binding CsgD family transcriptional regulator
MNMPLKPSNELRRHHAVLQDVLTSEGASLARLWSSLLDAEERIADAFFTQDRCYLILESAPPRMAPLTDHRRSMLGRMLRGECQNSLAIELGLAPSTVALNIREGMRCIGMDVRPSRCHPLPMAAALAAVAGAESWIAASSILVEEGRPLRVISLQRPEMQLVDELPSAELDVVRGLVEGIGYQGISQRRQRALRTIANQVSSVFRKYHVSGRNELLCHLLRSAMRPASPGLSSETRPITVVPVAVPFSRYA